MFNIGFDCNVADLTATMKKKPFVSGPFAYLLSTAISKAPHTTFLPLFFLGMVLIPVSCTMSQTSFHSSPGTLSDLGP